MKKLFLVGLLLLGVGEAVAQALKPGPPAIVAIETRDLTIEFAGDRAWTIYRILHKGAVVADKKGFYGTVYAAEPGKWIGTGHTEGGIEKVEQVTLTVDGVSRDLTDKAAYRGKRVVLEKQSVMGPLKLSATCIVTDDALLERHRYEVVEDAAISTLYAFMHPWVPATTEWVAQLADGVMVEGKFDQSGNFKLKADPKWTAIFNPVLGRAMLAWYPQPLAGQGLKTAYWDKEVYHKLYNQIYSNEPVKKGSRFEAAIVVRGVETDAAGWKAAVKTLADGTEAAQAGGKLGW